jgi:outer membrane lipoprotein SlyB
MTFPAASASAAVRPASSRLVWLIGASLGLVSLAAGGTIAISNALPEPDADAALRPVATSPAQVRAGARPAGTRLAAAAAKCADCGVVESVRSVTRKGQGTGLGAVAGGVVGAAVGNQIGKGNGRSAMTALGAVGGGVTGHAIEKHARRHTVHELRVRMDDGSLRTIEQVQPEAHAGDRVVVDGNTLRPAPLAKG